MAGSDTERLHQLGYAQELRRGMRTFSNFAVSFTIISILSGCLTLFDFAMNTGGPAVMTLGWLVVGFFVTLVALGMAEVASSYPTAGGLYYWAAKLAPESGGNPAAWSWFVGWFNFVGQVAVTAGIDFGLAFFINAFLNIVWGVPTDPPVTILIFGIVLFIHGLLNTFGIRLVALPERHLRLVARRRRRSHRPRDGRAQPAQSHRRRDGLLDLREQHGSGGANPEWPGFDPLRDPSLRDPDRPPERAVHAHRLRRVGPHVRGDPRRADLRAARDRVLGRRVRDLRASSS